MVTSGDFQKFIRSVTGKDITDLYNMWVQSGGVAHINASYNYDRKKNSAEIELRQDQPYGVQYVGPMIIRIQEGPKFWRFSIIVKCHFNAV